MNLILIIFNKNIFLICHVFKYITRFNVGKYVILFPCTFLMEKMTHLRFPHICAEAMTGCNKT